MSQIEYLDQSESIGIIEERAKKVHEKKYRYPAEVPILTSEHFCKNTLHKGNGVDRCCMIGWAAYTFGRIPFDAMSCQEADAVRSFPEKVLDALIETRPPGVELDERNSWNHFAMEYDFKIDKVGTIVGGNDAKKRPLKVLAAWWNRAMAKLGYVNGNPEAKKVKWK